MAKQVPQAEQLWGEIKGRELRNPFEQIDESILEASGMRTALHACL